MLLMGDEVGRSQGGNNNSWCQDNPLGWMLWNPEQCDMDLHLFVSRLLMIRHQLSELFCPINPPPEEMPVRLQQSPDDLWLQWHGVEIDKPDWGSWSHTICYSLNRGPSGAVMWMGFNAYSKAMHFDLPEPTSAWHRILDTARPSPDDLPARANAWTSGDIDLQNRSMLILLAREYASKLKL